MKEVRLGSSQVDARQHFEAGCNLAWIEDKTEEALAEFQTALKLHPDFPAVFQQIGNIHYHSTPPRFREAFEYYQKVIRLSPNWSEGHLWAANTLCGMDKLPEALVEYKEAIRLEPSDPRHHISFGICLAKLRHFDEAIKAFRGGIDLKPAYGEISARMMLADSLKEAGRIKEAIEEWQKVSSMKPAWDYEQEEPGRARNCLAQWENTI